MRFTDPTGHNVDCAIGESACKNQVKVENAERLLTDLIQKDEPVTWTNLTKKEQKTLKDVGWDPVSFDHSDYVMPSVTDVSGSTQDPAIWLITLVSAGKITPSILRLVQHIIASRGVSIAFAEGFTAAEMKLLHHLTKRTGVDFSGITFWRGTGAPPSFFGSSSPGSNNITLYDSFFTTTVDHQIFILKEEYAHILQIIVEFSDDSIRAAEQAAKMYGQGGLK